jgi:molecular chaperone DnaJ
MEDFYVLLGLQKNATAQEIKKAYRAKAREFHPDANSGDLEMEEKFKAISVAYEILSDPEKREIYDRYGVDGFRGGNAGSGFSNAQSGGAFDFNLSDIFESFFNSTGGGFSQNQNSQSNDFQVQISIDLKEACFGVSKDITLNMERACEKCQGSGANENSAPITCGTCEGAGIVQELRQSLFGQMMTQQYCPTCQGMGTIIEDPCNKCDSSGVTIQEVTLEINIPAGVDNGSRLKLAGLGPSGVRNTKNGDLYVSLTIATNENFERHSDDLVCVQEISFLEAIFGIKKDLDTFDGPQPLLIPGGTKTGEIFKLRSHGMGKLRSRSRGDLLVYVTVQIPASKDLTEEQKILLKQFAELNGDEIIEIEHSNSLFEKVKRVFS